MNPASHSAPKVTVNVAMAQVVKWLYAMSVQAHRIETAHGGILTIQAEADLHFFLIALSNFLKSVGLVTRLSGPQSVTIGEAIAEFHRDVPGSTDLRNMLEHYDRYLMGDGFLQKEARKRPQIRIGAGEPALLLLAGMPGQHTISVVVPGVDDFSVTVEPALSAAQRLASAVEHALD